MQPLLQLRQGAQLGHQGRTDRPQLGIVDLAPQPAGRSQSGSQGQQLLARSRAALGAEGHQRRDIGNSLKTQSPLQQPVEAKQLGGFSEQAAAGSEASGQGQLQAGTAARSCAGEAGQLLSEPRPLEQLQGLLLNWGQWGGDVVHPGRLEGMPPGGS